MVIFLPFLTNVLSRIISKRAIIWDLSMPYITCHGNEQFNTYASRSLKTSNVIMEFLTKCCDIPCSIWKSLGISEINYLIPFSWGHYQENTGIERIKNKRFYFRPEYSLRKFHWTKLYFISYMFLDTISFERREAK